VVCGGVILETSPLLPSSALCCVPANAWPAVSLLPPHQQPNPTPEAGSVMCTRAAAAASHTHRCSTLATAAPALLLMPTPLAPSGAYQQNTALLHASSVLPFSTPQIARPLTWSTKPVKKQPGCVLKAVSMIQTERRRAAGNNGLCQGEQRCLFRARCLLGQLP